MFSLRTRKLSQSCVPNLLLNSVSIHSEVTPPTLTCYPEYLSLRSHIVSKHCPLVHCNIQETKFHFGGCGDHATKFLYRLPFCTHSSLIKKKKKSGFHFKMSIKILLCCCQGTIRHQPNSSD